MAKKPVSRKKSAKKKVNPFAKKAAEMMGKPAKGKKPKAKKKGKRGS